MHVPHKQGIYILWANRSNLRIQMEASCPTAYALWCRDSGEGTSTLLLLRAAENLTRWLAQYQVHCRISMDSALSAPLWTPLPSFTAAADWAKHFAVLGCFHTLCGTDFKIRSGNENCAFPISCISSALDPVLKAHLSSISCPIYQSRRAGIPHCLSRNQWACRALVQAQQPWPSQEAAICQQVALASLTCCIKQF